jgi:hypothetical protein
MRLEKVNIGPQESLSRDAWMTKPYHYVRFRWSRGLDFEEIMEDLGEMFQVEKLNRPYAATGISLHKENREQLKVKADTLGALLAHFRVVLYQRDPAKFTTADMQLRARILKMYPRISSTFFPWSFSKEPEFQVADETVT